MSKTKGKASARARPQEAVKENGGNCPASTGAIDLTASSDEEELMRPLAERLQAAVLAVLTSLSVLTYLNCFKPARRFPCLPYSRLYTTILTIGPCAETGRVKGLEECAAYREGCMVDKLV